MTDFKTTLRSNIQSLELQKKKVKVTCANNKAGNLVVSTLTQNISLLGGHNYDIDKGLTSKDFLVKFKEKDHAQVFYENVMAIMTDNSVAVEPPVKSGWETAKENINKTINTTLENITGGGQQAPAEAAPAGEGASAVPVAAIPTGAGGDGEDGNKKIIIIGAAVLVILLVVGLLIWKSRN